MMNHGIGKLQQQEINNYITTVSLDNIVYE